MYLIQQDQGGGVHGLGDALQAVQVAAEGGQVLCQVLGVTHIR